ncbi:MAG: MarR family transcriptional regulator [Pseudomonadota bacterium]
MAPSDDVTRTIELLFFAYRAFTHDPDAHLESYGFGRAHHRVLHFVSRQPGMRVADLLDILAITKQSLAPVLKQLVDKGFIEQHEGAHDRRERRLHVTAAGARLSDDLKALQAQRLETAFASLPAPTRAHVEAFLFAIIDEQDREAVAALLPDVASGGIDPKR